MSLPFLSSLAQAQETAAALQIQIRALTADVQTPADLSRLDQFLRSLAHDLGNLRTPIVLARAARHDAPEAPSLHLRETRRVG